jgi:hypothetical protein
MLFKALPHLGPLSEAFQGLACRSFFSLDFEKGVLTVLQYCAPQSEERIIFIIPKSAGKLCQRGKALYLPSEEIFPLKSLPASSLTLSGISTRN